VSLVEAAFLRLSKSRFAEVGGEFFLRAGDCSIFAWRHGAVGLAASWASSFLDRL